MKQVGETIHFGVALADKPIQCGIAMAARPDVDSQPDCEWKTMGRRTTDILRRLKCRV